MLASAKQKKLEGLFRALPDDFLKQLQAACEKQFMVAPEDDAMPWDVLSDIARNVLAQRGIFVPLALFDEDEGEDDLRDAPQEPPALEATAPVPSEPAPEPPEETQLAQNLSAVPFDEWQAQQPVGSANAPSDDAPSADEAEDTPIDPVRTAPEAALYDAGSEEEADSTENEAEAALAAQPRPVLKAPSAVAIRPRNAMHAFFRPLETLIVDPPRTRDRFDGFLCSTYLPAIWRLIIEEEAGGTIREAWVRFELVADDEAEDILPAITLEMHTAARKTLSRLVEKAKNKPAYKDYLHDRLRGRAGWEDMMELRQILSVSHHLSRFAADLDDYAEAEVPGLQDAVYRQVTDDIVAKAGSKPVLASAMLRLLLRRLETPASAARIYDQLRLRARRDETIDTELIQVIPDYFSQSLEDRLLFLREQMDESTIETRSFDRFVETEDEIRQLVDESAGFGRNDFTSQFQAFQRQATQIFERLLDEARGAVHAVLPLKRMNIHGARDILRPHIDWLDQTDGADDMIARAKRAAQFLATADGIARRLNRSAVYNRALQPASDEVRGYANDLAGVIREARGERRLAAMQLSDHIIDIAQELISMRYAETLRTTLQQAARAA